MALQAFPSISESLRLTDGTTYAFVYSPAAQPQKPTFLLLHGFPSSSWDWRHQIFQLKEAGYGVLAPDLLGYGDTDKPNEVEAYSMKRMTGHVVEILQAKGLELVVAVAHDWGCSLLSRLVTYHRQYLLMTVFISVGYIEPRSVYDIDSLNALTKQNYGYPTFGHWKWFAGEDAAEVMEQNHQAALSLIYPADPETWRTDLCPEGGAEAWIASGKTTPLPTWITEEENTMTQEIMKRNGYAAPLRWYKAAMRGINQEDASKLHWYRFFSLPTMLICSSKDYATRADMAKQRRGKWTPVPPIKILDCGHWIQLEKREELFRLLTSFANQEAGMFNDLMDLWDSSD